MRWWNQRARAWWRRQALPTLDVLLTYVSADRI
jgi:hypothetical protein